MMEMAFITPVYAGIFAIALVVLSWRVAHIRKKQETGLMRDNAHNELAAAVRAQANVVEYLPVAMLLMWMLESMGYAPFVLHTLGVFLIFARLLHLHGLNNPSGNGPTRKLGTRLTWAQIVISAVLCFAGAFA